MNPADVAQSVLPLTSSDLSLFTLFWHAHWIVKLVMVGLITVNTAAFAAALTKGRGELLEASCTMGTIIQSDPEGQRTWVFHAFDSQCE